jgi:hypothetical protein
MTLPDDTVVGFDCYSGPPWRRITLRMTITKPEHIAGLRKLCDVLVELVAVSMRKPDKPEVEP